MRISLCANGHFYEFLRNYNFAEPCNLQILSRIPPRTHGRNICIFWFCETLISCAAEKACANGRLFSQNPNIYKKGSSAKLLSRTPHTHTGKGGALSHFPLEVVIVDDEYH